MDNWTQYFLNEVSYHHGPIYEWWNNVANTQRAYGQICNHPFAQAKDAQESWAIIMQMMAELDFYRKKNRPRRWRLTFDTCL